MLHVNVVLSLVFHAGMFGLQVIFNCRFFTLMAVVGSLVGSVLCFLKVWPGPSL